MAFLGNLFKKPQKAQSKLGKAQTIIEELPKRQFNKKVNINFLML
jgi:hypothetical protein